MAIPCGACAEPVHERAVNCPHCGGPTGVVANTALTADERLAALALAQAEIDHAEHARRETFGVDHYDHGETAVIGAAVAAVGVVLKTAVETVIEERKRRAALPRATARPRRARPASPEPAPAETPEPALPPSDEPRFLK